MLRVFQSKSKGRYIMSKNNTVQKQNTPTLNSKWFTDIDVINDGIFTSYKNYGTLYNNVNQTLSSTKVDDDLYEYLKNVVFELIQTILLITQQWKCICIKIMTT